MAPTPLLQEDPLQVGRYRLTARLGAGGMGVVYLGEADDGQQAAVKVLRPEYADDPESRARFRREVAAIARVHNRYTVQVLDADTDSATPFLATEFADGPSLSEQVHTHGPLEPASLENLASAVAEALAAIHAAGVTHRDLKPSNVLLTSEGPKVIDFGIAQVAEAASVTRTGVTLGSPGYMAPEQVTGHGGQEGDIFTWALIVAFAASGQPPFGTGSTLGIMHRILNDSPDISAVPSRLLPLVTSALARDPARRPAAADLQRELSPAAVPRALVPLPWRSRAAEDPGPLTWRWRSAGAPGSRRRWRAAAVAAPVFAVLAATGGVLLADSSLQPGSAPSAGGTSPRPATTSAAPSHARAGVGTEPAAGSVEQTGTPQTQTAANPQVPSVEVRKHRRDTGAAPGSSAATPSASPSATSPGSSSTTASPSPSPSSTSGTASPSPSPSPSSSSASGSPSPSSSSTSGSPSPSDTSTGSGIPIPTGSGG